MKRLRAEIYADALSFPYFSCVVKVQAALKSVLPSMNHHFALFQRAWDVYKNIVLNKFKENDNRYWRFLKESVECQFYEAIR